MVKEYISRPHKIPQFFYAKGGEMNRIMVAPGSMGAVGLAVELFGTHRVNPGSWTTPFWVADLTSEELDFAKEFFTEFGLKVVVETKEKDMLKYYCSSVFLDGMTWEDFLPQNDTNLPSVTVSTIFEEEGVEITVTTPEYFKDETPDAGNWYDAYIPEFTIDGVKAIIAKINSTIPENINIEWRGTSQAC